MNIYEAPHENFRVPRKVTVAIITVIKTRKMRCEFSDRAGSVSDRGFPLWEKHQRVTLQRKLEGINIFSA